MRIGIVTGASSGMGREFVKRIMKEDMGLDEIWLIARRKERLLVLQKLYKDQTFRILPLDLGDREDMKALDKLLAGEQPKISLLVHCAGFGIMGKISGIARQEQLEMVDINCRSVVELTSMVLPFMEYGSRMIYLASAAAFLPQPGFAVYAASKAFCLSFVRALRAELKDRKIRVTAVCPGAVKTEFFHRAAGSLQLPAYKKLVMADPEKVVDKAFKDSLANKEISIYGLPMKAFSLAAKLLPHSLFLRFM